MRIDPRTEDAAARQATKQAFYGDFPDVRFDAVANLLHPDEVASTAVPMAITAGKYGTVDRHYVSMDEDRAIPPVAQAMMIRMLDETNLGRANFGTSHDRRPFSVLRQAYRTHGDTL
jgi:hypothetical protein